MCAQRCRSFSPLVLSLIALLPLGSAVAGFAQQERDYAEGTAGRTGVFPMPEKLGVSLLEPGVATIVIFRIPGITDDGAQGASTRKEATSIHCTNFGGTAAALEVQVYQWNGSDVYAGSSTLLAGSTQTYSTQNTTIYFDDVIVGDGGGTPAIFQGSALVLSDSREVQCTAQALDPLTYPPIFMSRLEVYR